MTLHKGNGLNGGTTPNCYVHVDTDNRPTLLFGRIERQSAMSRAASPPPCLSGFGTDGTPFAKGHIMACELGGWDNSYNIVPQYENWQGLPGGAWRDMERAIESNNLIKTMVVRLTYGSPPDTYMGNFAKFQGGNTLFHWEDKRIPTEFEVWALSGTDPGGYFSMADTDKLTKADSIVNSLGTAGFHFRIQCMPDIDRRLWIDRYLRGYARRVYEAYKTDLENKTVASIVSKHVKSTSKASAGSRGLTKPSISTRPSRRVLVVRALNYADWFKANLDILVAKIKTDPWVVKEWTPTEISTFTGLHLDQAVWS